MYTIGINEKKKTERNPKTLCVLFFGHSEDWGTWVRTMKHRGINSTSLAERPMVEYEIENTKKAPRLHWLMYDNWDALIEDEYAATDGKDPDWINELLKLAKSTRTFDQIAAAVAKWKDKPIVKQQDLFEEEG